MSKNNKKYLMRHSQQFVGKSLVVKVRANVGSWSSYPYICEAESPRVKAYNLPLAMLITELNAISDCNSALSSTLRDLLNTVLYFSRDLNPEARN